MAKKKGEFRDERRARSAANEIWRNKYENCYVDHCDVKGLRNGFIDGFVDAAHGKTDCPPMFAPVNHGLFLHPKASCSMAWHNGYPMGQAAALSTGFKLNCCSRLHPTLRSYERPVNPGCVKIEDYQATQQNDHSPGIPMEVVPPVAPTMPAMEVVPPAAPIMPPMDVGNTKPIVETFDHAVAAASVMSDDTNVPDPTLVGLVSQVNPISSNPNFIEANTLPSVRTSGVMEDFFHNSIIVEEVAPDSIDTTIEPKVQSHWQSLPRTRSVLGELNSTFNWRASSTP